MLAPVGSNVYRIQHATGLVGSFKERKVRPQQLSRSCGAQAFFWRPSIYISPRCGELNTRSTYHNRINPTTPRLPHHAANRRESLC